MHIKHILLGMSIVSASMSFLGIKAVDSIQTIEVVNNSSKTMNITTNNTDSTLHIHQTIHLLPNPWHFNTPYTDKISTRYVI